MLDVEMWGEIESMGIRGEARECEISRND